MLAYVYSTIEYDEAWMAQRKFVENVRKFKMKTAKLSIYLLLVVLGKEASGKEMCPKICICDVFEGYKRADCR